MFRFLPSLKRVSTALFVLLAFSLPLLFTACGSSMSSTAPTPAPSPEWMWVSGSNTVGKNSGQPGIYGTLGTAATTNTPGGRYSALGWTDSSGNFWLFGGAGYDSTDTFGDLNDLWRLQP